MHAFHWQSEGEKMEFVVLVVLVGVAWIVVSSHNTKKRRAALLVKYGDLEIVEKIMRRMFWQGQTEQQLIDSLGHPLDIDQRVLKSKTKETWKYNRIGKNRYGLRVIIENGFVVGWDQK
jgi:hypothetical protein